MSLKVLKRKIKTLLTLIGIIERKVEVVKSINPKYAGTTLIEDNDFVSIGDRVSFGGNVLLYGTAPIEIGDNTMIAYHVIFHTSTHDYTDHPMWTKRIDRPIKVGKHVWIGTGAIILPGVIIGDYAVVAAGSVVNANVPEGAIVGGNPARILKYREKEMYLKDQLIFERDEAAITPLSYLENNCKMK